MDCKLIGFLFFTTLLAISFTACNLSQEKFEKEKALSFLDSLDYEMNIVRGLIERIDIKEVSDRKDFLYQELDIAKMYMDSTGVSQDDISVYEDIRALSRIYRSAHKEYKKIVMETEELFIQLKTLRKSVNNNEYSKEEFKQYFAKEKEDVYKLKEYAEIYLKPVIETDGLFERRVKELQKLNAPYWDKIEEMKK